ncbi:hypothetical protein GIB67_021452 [Kingdonia uniflora]|uniref:AAA-type ATPase N-terminal domain-containing protein n=1 Tax=Kingdonia uniflora TaxID=39325 RepID=A0A7J7NQK0_9MAGN|nr:hypothetical protein GIB67_021452 [Kingdonia uniflora]
MKKWRNISAVNQIYVTSFVLDEDVELIVCGRVVSCDAVVHRFQQGHYHRCLPSKGIVRLEGRVRRHDSEGSAPHKAGLMISLSGYPKEAPVINFFNPFIQITIPEFTGDRLNSNEAYTAIEAYLSNKSSNQAKRLKASTGVNKKDLVRSMDHYEEVRDDFMGATLWWKPIKWTPKMQQLSFYATSTEKRSYKLLFHKRYREHVIDIYLNHVLEQGRAIRSLKRQKAIC